MQRPCHRCGFISDRPTRFCRQCGAQLFVENEATSATTRQYAPRQPANSYDAPYQSQLAQARFAPDNQFNDQTPDTSRLYHNPMAPNYPNYPANYQQAVAKKSGAVKWILITLICVALVSGGIAAMVISAIRAAHNSRVQAPVPEPLAEPGSIPPPPRPPPASGQFRLEQYKYPNATVNESVRAPGGNEVVKMTTGDSVSKVRDYYKKQLGNPSGEVNNGDGERVVFRISGPPMVIITIGEDEEDSDKTQITVVRANMQLQKIFPK
jgi:hypothetical protein